MRHVPGGFVLPERLGYLYWEDGASIVLMLHRATLGSFERFIGILIENSGKLPFWLAPRQVVVASIVSDVDSLLLILLRHFAKVFVPRRIFAMRRLTTKFANIRLVRFRSFLRSVNGGRGRTVTCVVWAKSSPRSSRLMRSRRNWRSRQRPPTFCNIANCAVAECFKPAPE